MITGAKVGRWQVAGRILYVVVQLVVGDKKKRGEEINEFLPPFLKLDAHTGDTLNNLHLR